MKKRWRFLAILMAVMMSLNLDIPVMAQNLQPGDLLAVTETADETTQDPVGEQALTEETTEEFEDTEEAADTDSSEETADTPSETEQELPEETSELETEGLDEETTDVTDPLEITDEADLAGKGENSEDELSEEDANKVTDYEDISQETLEKLLEQARSLEESMSLMGSGSSRKADVVFVIDTTGSMSSYIKSVKENLSAFVNYLAEKGITTRFGIIDYRDITCDGMDSTVVHYSGLSGSTWYTSTEDTITELSRLSVGGGGDTPETLVDALGYLVDDATYNWSSNSTRCAIVLTDADSKYDNRWGYPKTGSSTSDVLALEAVADELARRNIVTSIITRTSYYSDYTYLADVTGGILGDINSNYTRTLEEMADTILKAAKKDNIGVYILPGYMGSQLYTYEDNSRIWVETDKLVQDATEYIAPTGAKGLRLGRDADGTGAQVYADSSRDMYGSQDTYKPLVDYLESNLDPESYTVKFFAYDWLGDLNDSERLLEADIKDSGYDKVVFVTHSTGGLLGSAYIAKSAYNRNKVLKAVMVAPPLYGTYTALEPLVLGKTSSLDSMLDENLTGIVAKAKIVSYPLIHKWIRATVINTPTTYQLLPSVEYLKLMPQKYADEFKDGAITSASDYYDLLNKDTKHINSNLTNGSNRSHKYFRDTVLGGDIVSVLNQVDTTVIGNSNCKPTPAIGVPQSGFFGGITFDEPIYKKDGDGTVMGVSALLAPVSGKSSDGIKRIDMSSFPNSSKLDHGGLVSEEDGLKTIVDVIEGNELSEYCETPEWVEDELYTTEHAGDPGMAQMAKVLVRNNQDTFFTVEDASGNVVAKATDFEREGFDELDGFTFDELLADEDEGYVYQIQVPKAGYTLKVYNSTETAPDSEIAVATLDRGGFRQATAKYSVKGFVDEASKLIAVIDLTAGADDESIKDLADADSGITFEEITVAGHDWAFETDEVILEEVGETKELKFVGEDADKLDLAKDVTWTSSDESVATVKAGVVTAKGYGKTTIYAGSNDGTGKTEVCTVIVGKYPESVHIDDVEMIVGNGLTPHAVFEPADANLTRMTFYSGDTSIVRVVNGSTLRAVSEGITEVTGKTVNGLECRFMVTVRSSDSLYVDKVSIDPPVAVLEAGEASTVVARIVPETALNKNVQWSIEDESVATFKVNDDNSCTITGHKEGVTKLSALTEDGSYTDDSTIVVGNILDVEGSQQIIMAPGTQKQLVLKKDGVLYPVTAAQTEDSYVVNATASGMLTAGSEGSAIVKLTGTYKGKTVSTLLTVSVSTDVAGAVSDVRILTTATTSNVYRKESGEIKLAANLGGAVSSSYKKNEKLENIAMAITAAEFSDAEVASLFRLSPVSDNTLAVKPAMDTTDAAISALKKKYESKIKVTIGGKVVETADSVVINVDTKKPVITAEAVTLNSFYLAPAADLVFKTDCGEVTKVAVNSAVAGAVPEGYVLDEDNMAVALDSSVEAGKIKSSATLQLVATTDEIRAELPVKVSVKIKKTVPGLKLSASSIKVSADPKAALDQQLTLLTKNKNQSLEDLDIAGITLPAADSLTDAQKKKYKINDAYSLTDFNAETGRFYIKSKKSFEKAPSGTLLIQVNIFGGRDKIQLPLKVSAVAKPSIKLSKSSFSFTRYNLGYISDSAAVTVTPSDYDTSKLKVKVTKNKAESSEISATIRSKKLTVTPTSSAKGTYQVKIYDGVIEKTVTVKVSTTRKYPKIKGKVSGALDMTDPSAGNCTAQISVSGINLDKDYLSTTISSAYTITKKNGRNYYSYATDCFKLAPIGGGKYRISLDTSASSYTSGNLKPGTYQLRLYSSFGGYNIGSTLVSVKVKQSKPKMSVNPGELVLTGASVSAPVPLVVDFANADATKYTYKVSGSAVDFVYVTDMGGGQFAVTLEDVYAGSSKSGKLTIEAFVPGSSKAVSSVTINVKVK